MSICKQKKIRQHDLWALTCGYACHDTQMLMLIGGVNPHQDVLSASR